MAFAIEWDKTGERSYEIGCDHGVLYTQEGGIYPKGVPWNGLTNVTKTASGGEATKLYADNIPYLTIRSTEEFSLTIECYTYPKEFEECDGSVEVVEGITVGQQTRKNFGMTFRTISGNDTEKEDHGYKIHLIYGCSVSPSEKGYDTVSDSPDPIKFSYEATSDPVNVPGYKPASELVIDSTKVSAAALAALEEVLYGKAAESGGTATPARLPFPDEIIEIVEEANAA